MKEILSHFEEDELPEWTLVLPDQAYTLQNAQNIAKTLDQVADDVLMVCAFGKLSYDFWNTTYDIDLEAELDQKTRQMKHWIKELLNDWRVYGWLIDGHRLIGNCYT